MKKGIKIVYICIIALILSCIFQSYYNGKVKTIKYSELVSQINSGEIGLISISSDQRTVTAFTKGEASEISGETDYSKSTKMIASIPSIDVLVEQINNQIVSGQLEVEQEEESPLEMAFTYFAPIIGFLILAFIFLLFMNPSQNNNKSMNFGKNKARMLTANDKNKVTFKDVAGLKEEKEELQEIVDFLKNPKKYTDMGARIPKGVLLVGHPGTGKTLLAKAIAGEAEVPFFIISGSDFVEMFVGVGASRVRDLFADAKKNAPCIVFIDEIDAVGRQRGAGLGGGHDEREQTLNQLLVEMDGFATNEGVIVLAATNRPDVLDVKAREEILEVHARKKKLADDVDLKTIAKNTAGFAGADLENVLNEAALLAARRNKMEIGMPEIEEAMVKVSMGPEKKSKVINEREKKLVSYHEAGHAISSYFLETQDDVHQISIIPRGMAGGYTMYKPSEDKSFLSKKEMEENLVSLLGGRVAEELILGDISTGASNDIERATKIARQMVTKYGMSKEVGTITFGSEQENVFLGRDLATQRDYSEATAALIDSEVKRIIDEAYKKTTDILKSHEDKLHAVAAVLMEKEKIDGDEFTEIMK